MCPAHKYTITNASFFFIIVNVWYLNIVGDHIDECDGSSTCEVTRIKSFMER